MQSPGLDVSDGRKLIISMKAFIEYHKTTSRPENGRVRSTSQDPKKFCHQNLVMSVEKVSLYGAEKKPGYTKQL